MMKSRKIRKEICYIGFMLFFAVMCFFPMVSRAADSVEAVRVFDDAGLFTEEEKASMEQEITAMQSEMDMDVVIVTTGDAGGKSAQQYAEDFYIDGSYGVGKDYSGVLFLIDMDNREIYLAPSGKMNRYLTDKRWNAILDDAYNEVGDENYAACGETFLQGVLKYYRAGIPSGQYNYDENTGEISVYRSVRWYEALLALVVAGVLAVIPCLSVINQYAMKKERRQADNYLMAYRADCNFKFADNNENLINKTVTHIIMPRNNGNGGSGMGGGASSGRSTTHTSSGRSFGGGGRKF